MNWSVSATEHVHALRSALAQRWADPKWALSIEFSSQIDWNLLRVRARYANVPGLEIQ